MRSATLPAGSIWDDGQLERSEIPVTDAPLATIGGGLGSFAVVDCLRIAGIPATDIRVLADHAWPWEHFESLAHASQLAPRDRLRSDSSSRIDNVWGWPSYALSEAVHERTLRPLLRVLGEPLLCEYFTPRLETLIRGLKRESVRIGWPRMLTRCTAEVVRRRREGGYFVLVRTPEGAARAYRARYVHVAVGYPGVRSVSELGALRAVHPHDRRVFNAYEPHDHVYDDLVTAPRRVLVRGSGITASRIFERLVEDRDRRGARTEIIHLFRGDATGCTRAGPARRARRGGFVHQPFNFPKAAGGGQLRVRAAALPEDARAAFIRSIGATSTPRRRSWQRQLARGRREGWYHDERGELLSVEPGGERLAVTVRRPDGSRLRTHIDYLLDAIGLDGDFAGAPLVADLQAGGAGVNALGRLPVDEHFEVVAMRSGEGRVYASGAATLGCALGPVDSLFGLTFAGLEICDDIVRRGAGAPLTPGRSAMQWSRWMRNREP